MRRPGGGIVALQRGCHVLGVAHDEDLFTRLEAIVEPRPVVAQQTGGRPGHLEDAGRRREAKVRHRGAIDVEDHARGTVHPVVVRGGNVADVPHIVRHSLVAPTFATEKEALAGRELRGTQKELVNARFPIGQAIAEEGDIAGERRIWRNGKVGLRIETVVHAVVRRCAELEETIARLRASAVAQDGVVAPAGQGERVTVAVHPHAMNRRG